MSSTSVVIVTVYVVEKDKLLSGVKVAVRVVELYVTEPLTEVVPAIRVNEDEFTEAGSTGSLNVAVTTELTATSVAPSGGLGEPAVGGMVSAVVKLQV